jgi:Eukaryotic aspartyl protease
VEREYLFTAKILSDSSSGLLGLAFGSINTVQPEPVATPVENMVAQKDIPESAELFTVYLGSVKDVSDPDKGESFYTFGAIDQSVVQASGQQISYTPVDNSQGLWMFDSASATVNGEAFQLSGNKAIADTGTTLMLVSTQFCEAIYQEIPGAELDKHAGGYTFPASVKTDSLPTVTVAVGGKQFTIEKEHLAWAPIDSSGTTIFGGIQDRGNLPFDILGDTFLLCVYAVSILQSWYYASLTLESRSLMLAILGSAVFSEQIPLPPERCSCLVSEN